MKNLQEELYRQLSLMNYERGKILSEQGKPENLMPYQSDYGISPNYTPEELVANAEKQAERIREIDPHILLPILSMATLWLPPLSMTLEGIDAAWYLAEGRYYEAGLAAAFMLIPGGAFGQLAKKFSSVEKKALGELLEKQAKGEVVEYTVKQKQLLKELGKEGTQKILKQKLAMEGFKKLLKEVNSITVLHRIVYKMVELGYLPVKFLITSGLQIGSVFYTWDAIGSALGLCNPMGLTNLVYREEEWAKKIGGIAKILQPFTNDCDRQKALAFTQEKVEEMLKNTKNRVSSRLQIIVDASNRLILKTSTFSNTYSLETLAVQLALNALGYTKFTQITTTYSKVSYYEPIEKEKSTVSNFDVSDPRLKTAGKYNDYDPTGGIGKARLQTPGLKASGNVKSDTEAYMQLVSKNVPKEEKKVVNVTFKWGYYDTNTQMVVKDFQTKNGLTVDGEVGVSTAKKLIELIKPLQTIDDKGTNISTLTDEDIKKIEDEVNLLIEKENTKPTPTQEQLTQIPTEEQIKKLTEEVEKNKTEEFNNIGSYEEFKNIFKNKTKTEPLKTLPPSEIKLK